MDQYPLITPSQHKLNAEWGNTTLLKCSGLNPNGNFSLLTFSLHCDKTEKQNEFPFFGIIPMLSLSPLVPQECSLSHPKGCFFPPEKAQTPSKTFKSSLSHLVTCNFLAASRGGISSSEATAELVGFASLKNPFVIFFFFNLNTAKTRNDLCTCGGFNEFQKEFNRFWRIHPEVELSLLNLVECKKLFQHWGVRVVKMRFFLAKSVWSKGRSALQRG